MCAATLCGVPGYVKKRWLCIQDFSWGPFEIGLVFTVSMAFGIVGNIININLLSKLNLSERWIVTVPCVASAIGLGLLVVAFGGIGDSDRRVLRTSL